MIEIQTNLKIILLGVQEPTKQLLLKRGTTYIFHSNNYLKCVIMGTELVFGHA